MSIPVIVFGDDTGRYISIIEKQRGEVSVARHAQDFSELLGLAHTGIARAVLIIGEHPELTLSMVGQLVELELGIVLVTDPDSETKQLPHIVHISTLDDDGLLLESLIRSVELADASNGFSSLTAQPVADISSAPDGEGKAQLEKTGTEEGEGVAAEPYGQVVTFFSGHGAPGRSTLAVNTAAYACEQGLSVCLVDADTYAPSVSALLGMLEDYSGLSQLCHVAERSSITKKNLKDAIGSIKLNRHCLDILTGITRADRWPELRAQPLAQVLAELRRHYDLIVIDVAPHLEEDEELSFDGLAPRRNAATITALEESDRIVMVGSGDVLGIPRTIRAFEELRELGSRERIGADISVWINKTRKQAAGASPETAIGSAWERFGPQYPIAGFLPYDQVTLDKSWLTGKTLVECAAKTEFSLAVAKMADSLITQKTEEKSQERYDLAERSVVARRVEFIEEPPASHSRFKLPALRDKLPSLSRKK